MFKRVLKIILILLAAFLLALLIIWFIGRNKSEKANQAPLSFRQFLGLGGKTNSAQNVAGTTSSSFTNNGGTGSGTGSGGTGSNSSGLGGTSALDMNPELSLFNNSGFTIGNGANLGGNATGSSSTNGSGLNSGSSSNSTSGSGSTSASTTSSTTPICSDADTNIQFTPQEISELNTLENQFYTIAQNLHTDQDVQTEIANHDAFALKADQVTELYNTCEENLPAVDAYADANSLPRLHMHVPTPFWESWGTAVPTAVSQMWTTDSVNTTKLTFNDVDPAQDSLTFLYFGDQPSVYNHLVDVHDNTTSADDNADTSGIKGPYGVLSWSNPTDVMIDGSILVGTTTSPTLFGIPAPADPLGIAPNPFGKLSASSDWGVLIPVVEKILRINLW